jgi:hypothetical protein
VGSPVASVGPGVGVEVGSAVGVWREGWGVNMRVASSDKQEARQIPYGRGLVCGRSGGRTRGLGCRRLSRVWEARGQWDVAGSLVAGRLTEVGSSVGAAVGSAVGSSVGLAVGY